MKLTSYLFQWCSNSLKLFALAGLASTIGFSIGVENCVVASPLQTHTDESKVPTLRLPSFFDGEVDVKERLTNWSQSRRAEVLSLFRQHVYGQSLPSGIEVTFKVSESGESGLGESVERRQVKIVCERNGRLHTMNLLIYLPAHAEKPIPVFLGLNFYGNQTVVDDPEIILPKSWIRNQPDWGINENLASEKSRGKRASRWPISSILERGYGVATLYYGDIDPDFDDGFRNGIHSLFEVEELEQGELTSISAWAWGLSRCLDYLETVEAVDATQVAVIGHSRLGKTSLWAGASDPRFGAVISNNSGCGGAALSRRGFGETVQRINTVFPHWFCKQFSEYNGNEDDCPVDQHMLIGLIAPRPVYVASASEDLWADPKGEFLAAKNAEPIYELFGKQGLGVEEMPAADQSIGNSIGYHLRTGKHNITAFDWKCFMDFTDRHWKSD